MSPEFNDLDRCVHGRHAQDTCVSCPGGQSTGNLFLRPGQRIGTSLYAQPIVVGECQRVVQQTAVQEGSEGV